MARETATMLVGPATRVHGRVHGAGDVEVHGSVTGEVRLDDHLWVADGGTVEAEAQVGRATVDGRVRGRWQAAHAIDVRAGAEVEGHLATPSLSLSPDATFAGHLDMQVDLPADLGGR